LFHFGDVNDVAVLIVEHPGEGAGVVLKALHASGLPVRAVAALSELEGEIQKKSLLS
jgi:hypothetical protein